MQESEAKGAVAVKPTKGLKLYKDCTSNWMKYLHVTIIKLSDWFRNVTKMKSGTFLYVMQIIIQINYNKSFIFIYIK